jgi:hypothetical protein
VLPVIGGGRTLFQPMHVADCGFRRNRPGIPI